MPKLKTRRGRLDLAETRQVWRYFGRYVRPHWAVLTFAGLAALGATATTLAMPWTIKVIFDYVLTDQMRGTWLAGQLDRLASSPHEVLAWVCGAIVVLALLDGLFSYWRDVLLAQTGQRVIGQIRQKVFAHMQALPPSEFERRSTGDLLTRLTGDILMLRQMLIDALITLGEGVLLSVAMIAAMFWLSPFLGAIALATMPLSLWTSWRISRKIRATARSQREKESAVAGIAHDALSSMAVIQAFNREQTEKEKFARYNRSTVRAGVKTTRLESRLYRTVSIASAIAMCLVLYFGVTAVLNGPMTAGDLLVFITYLRTLGRPMRRVARVTGQIAKATTCGERVIEILRIVPAVRDREGTTPLPPVKGRIEFRDVTFRYDNGQPALHNINLSINAGQRVAIVGHSGAGKTTLMKLLLRFSDPTEGRVKIDGHSLRTVTLASLRRQISWVHQDTVLFGLSIAENIALGREDAARPMIEAAAKRVEAHTFIDALPDGYDTVLGQSGAMLSGGERQRLALARAILRESPILLLDEPATGLDSATRKVVAESWMSPSNNATVIVICHRLHDMQGFDRVIYMSGGRVVADGTHEQLIRDCPDYARAYAADWMAFQPTNEGPADAV